MGLQQMLMVHRQLQEILLTEIRQKVLGQEVMVPTQLIII